MDREETETQHRESEPSRDAENAPGAGAALVSTTDASLGADVARGSRPERAVSFQTSQMSPPTAAYPFEPDSGDVERREDEGQRNGKHRDARHEAPQQQKQEQPPTASQPHWKTLLITGVVALACGVAGAWAYSAMFGPAKPDQQDKASGKDEKQGGKSSGDKSKSGEKKSGGKSGSDKGGGESGASASEIPGFSSAQDAATFKKELEHLAHRVDLLGQRVDEKTPPEHETPPGLHTLQMQVTELERTLDQVANLPSKLRQVEQRLSSFKEELKMVKDRVAGDDVPLGTDLSLGGGAPPPSPPAEAPPANNATLKLAMGLFREGHYTQAREVLRRLQRERPHDARVWYYSALANGLASGEWDGETRRFLEQGIERERAGTPSRAEIDESLAGLTRALGKDWLASRRRLP